MGQDSDDDMFALTLPGDTREGGVSEVNPHALEGVESESDDIFILPAPWIKSGAQDAGKGATVSVSE